MLRVGVWIRINGGISASVVVGAIGLITTLLMTVRFCVASFVAIGAVTSRLVFIVIGCIRVIGRTFLSETVRGEHTVKALMDSALNDLEDFW